MMPMQGTVGMPQQPQVCNCSTGGGYSPQMPPFMVMPPIMPQAQGYYPTAPVGYPSAPAGYPSAPSGDFPQYEEDSQPKSAKAFVKRVPAKKEKATTPLCASVSIESCDDVTVEEPEQEIIYVNPPQPEVQPRPRRPLPQQQPLSYYTHPMPPTLMVMVPQMPPQQVVHTTTQPVQPAQQPVQPMQTGMQQVFKMIPTPRRRRSYKINEEAPTPQFIPATFPQQQQGSQFPQQQQGPQQLSGTPFQMVVQQPSSFGGGGGMGQQPLLGNGGGIGQGGNMCACDDTQGTFVGGGDQNGMGAGGNMNCADQNNVDLSACETGSAYPVSVIANVEVPLAPQSQKASPPIEYSSGCPCA